MNAVNDVDSRDADKSSSSRNDTDNRKFIQISPESIVTIADSVGFSQIPDAVTKSLAEDTSYRLRELIQNCVQILRHSKRQKLGKDDVNLALRWSDIPNLHGQHPQNTDFEYLRELNVYTLVDKTVDLTTDYTMDSEVEAYTPPRLGVQFLHPDSEDRTRSDIYAKYFKKISQSLMSTTSCVVQAALKDLRENTKLQPLLPSLVHLLQNLAEYANENAHVARCIPRIVQAIMNNRHLNIEPQMANFLKLLHDLILSQDDTTLDEDNFLFASSISQALHQVSLENPVEQIAENFSSIIADPNRSLAIQCRSLLGLRALGSECLVTGITCEQWNLIGAKLQQACERGDHTLYEQEAMTSALVDVLRHRMRQLEQEFLSSDSSDSDTQQKWKEGWELYRLASEITSSSALRIGTFPASICRKIQNLRAERRGFNCNELYWTIRSRQKPSPQAKWQFETGNATFQKLPSKPVDLQQVFEDLSPRVNNNIIFRVRNWRQRPSVLLKCKSKTQIDCSTPSAFATVSTKLKPISKCCPAVPVPFCHPVELIL